jgi:hypothetical protein
MINLNIYLLMLEVNYMKEYQYHLINDLLVVVEVILLD